MYLLIYLTHFQEPLRKKRCPPFSCRMTSGLPSAVRETEFHLQQEQPTGHKLNYLETPLYIKKFRTINSESFKDTYIYMYLLKYCSMSNKFSNIPLHANYC